MVLSVAAATTTEGRSEPPSPVVQNVTWPGIRVFSVITANASTPQRDLPPFVESWHSQACVDSYVVNSTVPMPTPVLVCQSWQIAAPGVTDVFSAECFYTAWELISYGIIPRECERGSRVLVHLNIGASRIIFHTPSRAHFTIAVSEPHCRPHSVCLFWHSDGNVGAARGI